jgi:hypothetical protein
VICCADSKARGKRRCSVCSRWLVALVPKKEPIASRFWKKVRKTATCWLWTSNLDKDGYGTFWVGQSARARRAHRVAYELEVGAIPDGLQLDHACRNPTCVRPSHLEPVTCKENLRRSPWTINTINGTKTHCKRGHEFTPENTGRQKNGRYCRACARAAAARRPRRSASSRKQQRAEGGMCVAGHQLTSENVYRRPSGAIECRICVRARGRALRKKDPERFRNRLRAYRKREPERFEKYRQKRARGEYR